MATVTVHAAKTNLSELLRRVEAGEEIIIARGNKPVALLKGYDRGEMARRRRAAIGSETGKYPPIPDEVFFGPASDAEIIEMYGQKYFDTYYGSK